MEIILNRNFKSILSFLLIVILVIGMIMTTYVQADAFAQLALLAINPVGIVIAVMLALGVGVAMGITDWQEMKAMGQAYYNSMPDSVRLVIDNYSMQTKVFSQAYGLAKLIFSAEDWAIVKAWFLDTFQGTSGSLSVTADYANWNNIVFTGQVAVPSAVITAYNSSEAPYKLISYQPNASSNYIFMLYTSANLPYTSYTPETGKISTQPFNFSQHWSVSGGSGAYTYGSYGAGFVDSDGVTNGYIVANNFTLTNSAYSSTDLEAGLKTGGGVSYDWMRDTAYDPVTNPIQPDISGNTTVTVPYGDIGADTTVDLPSDNSVSLDTIIDAYGSLDGFFDAGNAITLADGTVIGGLTGMNDISRSQDVPLANTGTGAIDTDVSGIKSIVGSISGAIGGLLTMVSDWTTSWSKPMDSTYDIDWDPLKVNLMNKFPFCIPFDFMHLVSVFSAQPSDFSFVIALDTSYFEFNHVVDLSPFMMPILFFRYVAVAWFIYILISKTRDMIKW